MKKTFLLLLPLTALLVSCGELKVTHTDSVHSAGIEGSYSHTNSAIEYAYYSGDDVDASNENVSRLTFSVSESKSNIKPEDVAPLINCDDPTLVYEVKDASNVGTKEGVGLFVGADSTYVDGYLTISFDKAATAVVIKARRYYYETISFNESEIVIDSDVAVAINNSKYIKLTGQKNDSGIPNEHECRYRLTENASQLQIKVGPRRAFIEEIALYF